jgi:hypothetical protein
MRCKPGALMSDGCCSATAGALSWVDAEIAGCRLGDKRLVERPRRLLGELGEAVGRPLPLACQDWAGTTAAYRFFSNSRFGEDAILSGHFAATASRVDATAGPIFVIQDTTGRVFAWAKPEAVGAIGRGCTGRDRDGTARRDRATGPRDGTATANRASPPNAGC